MKWRELKEKMESVGFKEVRWPGNGDKTLLAFGPHPQTGFVFQMSGDLEEDLTKEEVEREIANLTGRFKGDPGSKEVLEILEEVK